MPDKEEIEKLYKDMYNAMIEKNRAELEFDLIKREDGWKLLKAQASTY